ncbi:hypothetical protein VNO78_20926 [Psophocarpus tetragonolobus]|uniref:Uncharacterized protein n=1 Tax=Psophocarpus tetragonolobus TaxID=3891 RepID=A0AAN9SAU5_PSOTE
MQPHNPTPVIIFPPTLPCASLPPFMPTYQTPTLQIPKPPHFTLYNHPSLCPSSLRKSPTTQHTDFPFPNHSLI